MHCNQAIDCEVNESLMAIIKFLIVLMTDCSTIRCYPTAVIYVVYRVIQSGIQCYHVWEDVQDKK